MRATNKQFILQLLRTPPHQQLRPVEEIMEETLERLRGERNVTLLLDKAAADWDVTEGTARNWCKAMGFDLEKYTEGTDA